MEDLLLLLVLVLIFAFGFIIMAVVDRALEVRRRRKAMLSPFPAGKPRCAKNDRSEKTDDHGKAECFIAMSDPVPVEKEDSIMLEQS